MRSLRKTIEETTFGADVVDHLLSRLREFTGSDTEQEDDLASVSNVDLVLIMNRLNHRPRKCLDFLSPFEVFCDQSVALTS